jgi:hypothetical protein
MAYFGKVEASIPNIVLVKLNPADQSARDESEYPTPP